MAAARRAGAPGCARPLTAPPHPGARAAPPPPRPFEPIRAAMPADRAEIEALLDAAFGPGRHRRTASLLRIGAEPIEGVSLIARDASDCLIGSIQYWPIALVGEGVRCLPSHFWKGSGVGKRDAARPHASPPPGHLPDVGAGVAADGEVAIPLTLLGPVAVAASARSLGLGRKLIAASLALADARGLDPILLIGDEPYYGRFGFTADATGDWALPGPVERKRLLLRRLCPTPLPVLARVVAADSVRGAKAAKMAADA